MADQELRPCKWLRVHRVFDGQTREYRGSAYICGFKVETFNRGRIDALYKFIELLESRGIQGLVGAQHDCPVAAQETWAECPVYEQVPEQ